jgi:outer membrane protein assembly factor BamD (BamD/ComL family)
MNLRSFICTLLLGLILQSTTTGQAPESSTEKNEMLYRRGLTVYQAGDYNSAESFFEQTLETSYSANAAVYLTYIRKETGDFKGALESLQLYLDQTGTDDSDIQSYISLKLFLEARIASQENEAKLSSAKTTSLIAIVIAVLAVGVSIISLRKK